MPALRPWEILVAALALVPSGIVLVQRNLVYRDEQYGLFDDDVVVLFLWLVIAAAILLAGKPWQPWTSRLGSPLRWFALGMSLLFACLMGVWGSGWGRYQTVRFETLVVNLGITNWEKGKRRDLSLELLDPDIGPYMVNNPRFLRHVISVSDRVLEKRPRSARVVVTSLLGQGTTLDELLALPNGANAALGALLAESDPKPWHRLEYIPRPQLAARPDIGLEAGVFSEAQGKVIIEKALEGLDKADAAKLETLVVAMMSFPTLMTDSQREQILARWAQAFEDLEELAVEGLVTREQVLELLAGQPDVKVAVELLGATTGSVYRDVPETLPRMVLGLIHSCGVATETVPKESAQLNITLRLSEIAHHDYSRPTYDYETYYETRSSGSYRSGFHHTRQVKKERQVVSGYENVTVFVPVAEVEMRLGERTLKFPQSLLHWHNLRYDYEQKRFLDPKGEEVFGRMWPLGVHEKNFVYGYMTDVY